MNRFAFTIFAAALLSSLGAQAHDYKIGELVIGHPWTRTTPDGATVGVGYLKITNNGPSSDRLAGSTFEGASSVEVHEMQMDGDKMSMRQLTDGVEIKPGQTVEFKPTSLHLMFLGLKRPIAEGPILKGTLTFQKAGTVDVEYKVEAVGAAQSADHH